MRNEKGQFIKDDEVVEKRDELFIVKG